MNLDLPCGHFTKSSKNETPHPQLRQLEKLTAEKLIQSPFYQKRNGADHLMLITHKDIRWPLFQDKTWLSVLKNVSLAYYEQLPMINMNEQAKFGHGYPEDHSNFWACTVPIPYRVENTDSSSFDSKTWFKREFTFGFYGDFDRTYGPRKYSKSTLNLRARFSSVFTPGPTQSNMLKPYPSFFVKSSKSKKINKKCDFSKKITSSCYSENHSNNFTSKFALIFPSEIVRR